MRVNNFALRLPDSLYQALKQSAEADGVAMNQYVAIALAEKISARKTAAEFFAERAKRGSLPRALEILAKAGSDVPEEAVVREILGK